MTFWDKTWIQLLCVMQLEMNQSHFFWPAHDKSTPQLFIYFPLFWSSFKWSLQLFHVAWSTLSSLSSRLMTCFSSQVDFTSCGGFLCIAAVLLMIVGIVTAVVLSFQYVRTLLKSLDLFSLLMFLGVSSSSLVGSICATDSTFRGLSCVT